MKPGMLMHIPSCRNSGTCPTYFNTKPKRNSIQRQLSGV